MKRLLYLVIALVFLLTSPLTASANSTIGSLDCNQADPTLWHDGSGLTFGQGNGAASSLEPARRRSASPRSRPTDTLVSHW